jgi:hypothetical protein
MKFKHYITKTKPYFNEILNQCSGKTVIDFLQDFGRDEEPTRKPNGKSPESGFCEKVFALSPPFAQMVVGHSQQFWLSYGPSIRSTSV